MKLTIERFNNSMTNVFPTEPFIIKCVWWAVAILFVISMAVIMIGWSIAVVRGM